MKHAKKISGKSKLGIALGVLGIGYVIAEWKLGYYECSECGYRQKPSLKDYALAPHIFTKRYMFCPDCEEEEWFKKDWHEDLGVSLCVK